MSPNSTESEFEETIKNMGDLHGNMAVLSRLHAILKNVNTDLSEPERLIQSDGAISGTIVNLSNSPLYGINEKSENIAAALQKVGYQQTLTLVGMALSKQVFMRELESYGLTADSYWRYSYFTAVFLERQAKRLGLDSDEAYLYGLLHSIGRVVINEILCAREVEVFWDRLTPEAEWELMMIGLTNARAGALLLKNWNFPPELYQRVKLQNDPAQKGKDTLITLLDYAKILASQLADPPRLHASCRPDSHPARKKLKLPQAEMVEEVAETKEHVEAIYSSIQGS